jgi:GNAT superfamily N-acetyltransferase
MYWVRRDGWRPGMSKAIQDIVALPHRHTKFVVMARSLLEPLPDLQPKMTLEIREFEPADVDLVRQINCPSEARVCAQRLARGHKGLVAQHKAQVVGYGWGCTEMSLERMPVQLDSGDMLCTDAYTTPAFRGQGVQTAIMLARLRLFRDLGYNRALTCIIENNYPSLTVWRKVDSQVVKRGDFRRIGPWRRVRYS